MHYLWRAVDHEGEVLESYASKTRDKPAALRTHICRSDDENGPCSASGR